MVSKLTKVALATGPKKGLGLCDKERSLILAVMKTLFQFTPFEENEISKVVKRIQRMSNQSGPEYTIRYLKAYREVLLNFLNLRSNGNYEGIYIGITKAGFPKILPSRFKSLVRNKDPRTLRLCLSIASLQYLFTVSSRTDLSSVTERFESTLFQYSRGLELLARKKQFPEFVRLSFDTCPPSLSLTSRSGPNGAQMLSLGRDTRQLLANPVRLNNLQALNECVYKDFPAGAIQDLLAPLSEYPLPATPLDDAKMSHTFEPGKLKPRIFVAVGTRDQQFLRPLHEQLMGILRTIPDDCTFNQNLVTSRARLWYEAGVSSYYDADMSNASDRLPKAAYELLGNELFPNMGSVWIGSIDYQIAVSRELQNITPSRPSYVRYATGQPLGMLSSWPFMAILHHTLVWIAAGGRDKAEGNYLILGDDFVTTSEKIYQKYCELLQELGINFTNSNSNSHFEFAKRDFIHGTEVTGLYSKALCSVRNDPIHFLRTIQELKSRGFPRIDDFPNSILNKLELSRRKRTELITILEFPITQGLSESEIRHEVATWTVTMVERSLCNLRTPEAWESALKPFYQGAAMILRNMFQGVIDGSRNRFAEFSPKWKELALRKLPEIAGSSNQMWATLILSEIMEDYKLSIRVLEKEWKLLTISKDVIKYLQPKVPEIFYLDLQSKDKLKKLRRMRLRHQRRIRKVITTGSL